MRILMVHKFYYIEGGAERYLFNLSGLLERSGDKVLPFSMRHPRNFACEYDHYFADYFEPDKELADRSLWRGLNVAARVMYNVQAQSRLEKMIKEVQPDIAHVHGVYHHLSPSVLWSMKKMKLPVVFTLHEYKILCPAYLFLDGQGQVCELCAGRFFWHACYKKCFRNSYAASALVSLEAYLHRFMRTYHKTVDLYISPSQFLRRKMIEYGFPEEKVEWLPYTIPLADYETHYQHEDYCVYVGRLSYEKGIVQLVQAMKKMPQIRLKIIGTGRLEKDLNSFILTEKMKNVELLGYKQGEELRSIVKNAMFVVVPSVVYDNSPLSIYEAFAHGKPVVGARIGGIPELIEPGQDGFLFTAGDEDSMIEAMNQMFEQRRDITKMGQNARKKAENLFGEDVHLQRLRELYKRFL